jgi:hypothetical protein
VKVFAHGGGPFHGHNVDVAATSGGEPPPSITVSQYVSEAVITGGAAQPLSFLPRLSERRGTYRLCDDTPGERAARGVPLYHWHGWSVTA